MLEGARPFQSMWAFLLSKVSCKWNVWANLALEVLLVMRTHRDTIWEESVVPFVTIYRAVAPQILDVSTIIMMHAWLKKASLFRIKSY